MQSYATHTRLQSAYSLFKFRLILRVRTRPRVDNGWKSEKRVNVSVRTRYVCHARIRIMCICNRGFICWWETRVYPMSVYAHQFFFCNIVFHVRFLIFLVLQPTSIVTRNSLYNSIRRHQHSEFFDLVKSLYVKKSIDFYTLTSINARDAQLADFSRAVCVCHFITL